MLSSVKPSAPLRFETSRLLLREQGESDMERLARINADPDVMRYYVSPLTRAETASMVSRNDRTLAEHGFSLWAVEVKETGEFGGYIGLAVVHGALHSLRRNWLAPSKAVL